MPSTRPCRDGFAHLGVVDRDVALRGGQRRVPQQDLNQSHVVCLIVNLGGAEVAQLVHRRSVGQSPRDKGADPVRRQVATKRTGEQVTRWRRPQDLREIFWQRENPLARSLAVHDECPTDDVSDDIVLRGNLSDFSATHAEFVGEPEHQANTWVGNPECLLYNVSRGRTRPRLLGANHRNHRRRILIRPPGSNPPRPEPPQ